MEKPKLKQFDVPTPIKLSLLWAALIGLFIYNDYFSLFLPGFFEDVSNGIMGPLGPATDRILIIVAFMLAIPALMIALSSILPAIFSKWSNVAFGTIYTAIEVMTFIGSRPFYQMVVVFEILVTLCIVWLALRWPKEDG